MLVGAALLALALAVVAFPRMIAGALYALAPGVNENGAPPQADEIAKALPFLERAQGGGASSDVGARMAWFQRLAGKDASESLLADVVTKSPLRPREWFLLARQWSFHDPERALKAWRMSVYAGRVFPPIMEERLETGLMLRDRMAPPDLTLLDDQVRLSFVLRPAHTDRVMNRPHNGVHQEYFARIVRDLSVTDIDAMIRIHALH